MKKKSSHTGKVKKDRTRNDKGKLLEQIVAMLHEGEGVKVELNVKLIPRSGDETRKREMDVLLTRDVAGYPVRVAIQCKNYGKPITVGQIGEFRDLLEDADIPLQHGIIVSVHGYQSGAESRAEELGIKTFVLEGLDKTRLKKEIQDAFQYFVHLLLVVEQMEISTNIFDGHRALFFGDENKKFCGNLTDLIVSHWRNGELPMELGAYQIELKLPNGWHQISDDNKLVYPSSISTKVRVVGYLAEMKGEFEEFKLKETNTSKIERFHLQANFDVINNLITSSYEKPIFTEEELKNLKKDVKVSIENRIRLPKIYVFNHLEPMSEKVFSFLRKGAENLSLDEVKNLPQHKFEELEGDAFSAMQEGAAFGEPVIIKDEKGNLIDIRLLAMQDQFSEIIGFLPLLQKYPREDFAGYLTDALLTESETLLRKSLSQDVAIKKVIETQVFNYANKAIKITPNLMDTYYDLGLIFRENELFDKSIQLFNLVITAQPQNALARYGLAETYFKMNNLPVALITLNKAINEVQESLLDIYLLRAKIYETLGHYKEATADLITVWMSDCQVIIQNRLWVKLVDDVYAKFNVLGLIIILSDIHLHYAYNFAKDNLLDKSKNYLSLAIRALERIYTDEWKNNKLDDFIKDGFIPVLSRAKNIVEEINSFYPTNEWKVRLESLKA